MVDHSSYKRAVERREKILKELEILNKFIELYEEVFGPVPESTSSMPDQPAPRESRPARNPVPPAKIAEIAAQIIEEESRPMTRGELVDSLLARGIKLAAKDPAKNVGTILWRHEELFVNLPGWGYWLKDRPFEPASYPGDRRDIF